MTVKRGSRYNGPSTLDMAMKDTREMTMKDARRRRTISALVVLMSARAAAVLDDAQDRPVAIA